MKNYSKERDLFLLKNYPVTRVIVPILKFIGWSLVIVSLGGSALFYMDNPDSEWLELISFFPLSIAMVAVAEILVDEIHTPDSSRFFYKDSYNKSIDNGVAPKQLSKEFFRQWLIENNFQGKENQSLPKITDEIVKDVSNRYIELYNKILGLKFDKSNNTNSINQIEENIIKGLNTL